MELKDRVMTLLGIARGPVGIDVITNIVAPNKRMELGAAVLELVMSGQAIADIRGVSLAEHGDVDSDKDAFGELEPPLNRGVVSRQVIETEPISEPEPMTVPEPAAMTESEPEVLLELESIPEFDLVSELKSNLEPEPDQVMVPEPELEPELEPEPESEPEPELVTELESKLVPELDNDLEPDSESVPKLDLYLESKTESEDELPPWPWPEFDDGAQKYDPPVWSGHEYDIQDRSEAAAQSPRHTEGLSNEEILRTVFTEDSIDELVSLLEGRKEEGRKEEESHKEVELRQRYCYVHKKCPVACLPVPKNTVTKLKSVGICTIEEVIQKGASPEALGLSARIAMNVSRALKNLPKLFPWHVGRSQLIAACRLSGNSEYGFDMFGLAVRFDDCHVIVEDDGFDANVPYAERFSAEARMLVDSARRALDVDGWIFYPTMFEITVLPMAEKALRDDGDPLGLLLDNIWAMEGFADRCALALSVAYEKRDDVRERLGLHGLRFSGDHRWQSMVESLTKDGAFDYDAETGLLSPHHYSLREWLGSLPGNRGQILARRFEGRTLQEVGEEFGLTRERVRQLQVSLTRDRPALVEDDLRYLVETYAISRDMFCDLTGVEPMVYGYLDFVAETRRLARLPVEQVVKDTNVPEDIRMRIGANKTETSLLVNGKHVRKTKRDVTLALLADIPGEDAVSFDWLVRRYQEVIEQNDERGNPSLRIVSRRAYGAWLARQQGILYVPLPKSFDGKRHEVRLYDTRFRSFERLETYLSSLAGNNIECSAQFVFEAESFAGLREDFDIRNGYELHTIIRRFCDRIKGVQLGRCPMITFGCATRKDQLIEIIRARGPISADKLALAYEEKYGVDAFLVQMNYLKEVSSFRTGDYYEDKVAMLTDDQMDVLRALLADEINVLEDVRKKFVSRYPQVDASTIGSAAFGELGYEVRREIVVREGFDMRAYAGALIGSLDRFEIGMEGLPNGLAKDPDFEAVLKSELRAFRVVEVSQGSYRSLRSLKWECPLLNEELLRDYLVAVIRYLKRDEVETIYSMRRKGLKHSLHDVIEGTSLGDGFLSGIASMGYVGGRIKRTRANGVLLLSKRSGSLTMNDFIESVAKRYATTDSRAIHKALLDDYGVRISGAHVRAIVNNLLDEGFTLDHVEVLSTKEDKNEGGAEESSKLTDAIRECVSKSGRMPVARLLNRLQSQYGLELSAVQLRSMLREMDVRYDERRDFVYSP